MTLVTRRDRLVVNIHGLERLGQELGFLASQVDWEHLRLYQQVRVLPPLLLSVLSFLLPARTSVCSPCAVRSKSWSKPTSSLVIIPISLVEPEILFRYLSTSPFHLLLSSPLLSSPLLSCPVLSCPVLSCPVLSSALLS